MATAYVAIALVVLVVGMVLTIESGPLVVLFILSPHLALASTLAIPVAILSRSRTLAGLLVALVAVFALRFGGEWWSPPATVSPSALRLTVATWNVESGVLAGPAAVETLNRFPVDLVVLEELTPAIAAAIEADARITARYPHRALFPTEGVGGIGPLSSFPIADPVYRQAPVRLEARVELDDGPLVVLGAHPFPARIGTFAGLPITFDPRTRNAELALLRRGALELDVQGERVLLIGDFNTAPTEPAFNLLTSGLRDAVTAETHCPPTGDHCLLWAELGR